MPVMFVGLRRLRLPLGLLFFPPFTYSKGVPRSRIGPLPPDFSFFKNFFAFSVLIKFSRHIKEGEGGAVGGLGPTSICCQAHSVGATTEEVAAIPAPSSPSTPRQSPTSGRRTEHSGRFPLLRGERGHELPQSRALPHTPGPWGCSGAEGWGSAPPPPLSK